MGRKFALIIANKTYDDPRLSRLEVPDVDAGALEAVLKSPDVGHFDDVTTLVNENCAVVRKAIARFFDHRLRDDLLLVYFAGLGLKDEQGHLHLALRDTDSALLAGTAIESAFISGRMDGSVSWCQVLLLDCRYSAAFAAGSGAATGVSVGAARAFEGLGVGRVILAATDAMQYAWDGDRLPGETQDSLFTRFLIDGLATGGADRDGDGVVTVDELYDYVHEHVIIAAPQQTTHKWTYHDREIILARNPFASPFTLPPEIEDARHGKLPSLRLDAVRSLEALLREEHTRAALAALRELSQDDSRRVAAAAIEVLRLFDEKKRGGAAEPMLGSTDARIAGTGTDIFISYAREDRAKAGTLARLLAARGWKVSWDRRIQPGEAFDVVIERELSTSKCVVVLWSANSVNATWVRNEARRASRRGVLVPIVIDRVETPLEFDNLDAADLASWNDSASDAELEALFDRIEALSPIRHSRPSRPAPSRPAVEDRRRVDENVRFSVYRPAVVVPERWYPMLAFAHLSERRPDAPADDPDPIAEVQRQAQQILGAEADAFAHVTEDSRLGIPLDGHLRIVPAVPGVDFNPRERSFLWTEPVHREEFRLRARRDVDGTTVRGTVSVFLDCLLVADVSIAIAVKSGADDQPAPIHDVARPYRRIFASYCHRDAAIVSSFEGYARGFGDRYMRDVIDLRAGEVWDRRLAEMIEDADVFQLFWSWNAMGSPFVRAEWEHALKMNRASFIRPVYWETPFPERGDLPPAALKALHFANVGTVVSAPPPPRLPPHVSAPRPPVPASTPAIPAPVAPPGPAPRAPDPQSRQQDQATLSGPRTTPGARPLPPPVIDDPFRDPDAAILRRPVDAPLQQPAARPADSFDTEVREARWRMEEEARGAAAKAAAEAEETRAREARRREAERKISEATARLEFEDLDRAGELLKAAELAPQDPRVAELAKKLQEMRERKEAEAAAERCRQQIDALMQSATQHLQSAGENAADLVGALNEVNQVLALEPEHAKAPGLKAAIEDGIARQRETARARAEISNARRRFALGKHQAALKRLEGYATPPHPEVADALNELRAALDEIQEKRRVEGEQAERLRVTATLLGSARAAIQGKRFREALDTLAALRAIDPTAGGLAELTELASRGHATPAASAYESSDATVIINPESLEAAQSGASAAQPWQWGKIVAVGLLVLAVIVALLVVLKAW